MNFTFYKTETNQWYVDLPEFIAAGGTVDALEMVDGADVFLDLLSGMGERVRVDLRTTDPEDDSFITCTKVKDDLSGATYTDNRFGSTFWLCSVAHWVFGEYPEKLYFKRI